jgi:hypothetical protein
MNAALVTIVALQTLVLVLAVRWFVTAQAEAEARWSLERRELLNRIQRPEAVPLHPVANFQAPDTEPDDIELVGTIAYPDENEN